MATFLSEDFRVNADPGYAGDSVSVGGHSDGTYFISWTALVEPFDELGDSRFSVDIIGRAFAGLDPLGTDYIVNDERRDGQFDPHVAARADGSYVVAYSSGEENRLPGTYAASRIIGADGNPVGPERFGIDTYLHRYPDVAILDGGGYILVSTGENDDGFNSGDAQVHASDGTILAQFDFGYSSNAPVAVTALGGSDVLLLWHGFATADEAMGFDPEGNPIDTVEGIYAQTRAGDGTLGTPFLVAPINRETTDFSARLLADGRVAVTFTNGEGDGTSVFVAIVDVAAGVAGTPTIVDAATAGAQYNPEMTVLETGDIVVVWQDESGADGSGSGIRARLFDADGAPDGAAFVVNADAAGSQSAPSVAATGGGRFVVAWNDQDGIEARLVLDAPSDSPLLARAGTIDLSPSVDQVAIGTAAANSVYVDSDASSGSDRVTDFGGSDVLLVTRALPDANRDGIIGFGRNGVLDLDGAGGESDVVAFDGVRSLRALGESDGLFVYAKASVRPAGAIEGTLASETLTGDALGTVAEVFFHDNALGADLGDDRIERFGASDLLVTTTLLVDRDGDGIVSFGADRILDAGQGMVSMTRIGGAVVSSLEYDGSVVRDGVTYFVYSLVGSAADAGDLFG